VERRHSSTGPATTLEAPGTAPSPVRAPAPRTPAARRKSEPRPVPTRDDAYAHLSLHELRAYRKALTDEEGRVSYWRRILQARLDVVQAGATGRELDTARLRPVLTTARVGAGRQALVDVLPADDIPPLPSLAELWERRVDAGDPVAQAQLARDLVAAEVGLSTYRSALHRRIADATGELIARYREQPGLCLSALPGDPARSRAV